MTESVTEDDVCDLDVGELITLVEERPVLWDRTCECYKSKRETSAAWRDICIRINSSFEQLTEEEKNKYGKSIIKRWTNLRDRYIKYLKKVQDQSTGSKTKKVKKYVYSEQMSFLRKESLKRYNTVYSFDDSQVEEICVNVGTNQLLEKNETTNTRPDPDKKPPPNKKPKYTEVEKNIINKLKEPDDRHISFFKGILPSLQLLRDDEVLRFQSSVLQVIQDIHRARQTAAASPQPGYNIHSWSLNYPPLPPYPNQVNYHLIPSFGSHPPQIPSDPRSTQIGSTSTTGCPRSEINRLSTNDSSASDESDISEISFGK